MLPLIKLVLTILDLYKIVIIAGAILSWLIAFGVVNIRNDFVRSVWNLFLVLTEPFCVRFGSSCPTLAASTFLRSSSFWRSCSSSGSSRTTSPLSSSEGS